eukprot:366387-Chlamydomonas_euryale.AAC.1
MRAPTPAQRIDGNGGQRWEGEQGGRSNGKSGLERPVPCPSPPRPVPHLPALPVLFRTSQPSPPCSTPPGPTRLIFCSTLDVSFPR